MIFAALLLAATPQTAIEADRALAAAVQREGQWTAFRRFAGPGAIFFQRGAHDARMLARWPDPKTPFTWKVHESITSCDGTTAVTLGPVRQADGKGGMLLLVWRKQPDGSWKWVVWRGGAGPTPDKGPVPRIITASCKGSPHSYARPAPAGPSGGLSSPDGTLIWHWETDRTGAVTYSVQVWNGVNHASLTGGDKVPVPGR